MRRVKTGDGKFFKIRIGYKNSAAAAATVEFLVYACINTLIYIKVLGGTLKHKLNILLYILHSHIEISSLV